jgi:predicted permease
MTRAEPRKVNDTVLVVAFFGAIFVAVIAFTYGGALLRDQRERRLLADGLPASAQVVSVLPTGNFFNNQPEMRLTLEVRPPQGEPFAAEVIRVVGVADMPRLAPGQTVTVRYSPEPPRRVAIAP